jgi:MscS family membrane protein
MENLTALIWTNSIYIIIAFLTQLIFFKKWSGKFFGKREETMKMFRKPIVFGVWVTALCYVLEQTLEFFKFSGHEVFLESMKTCLLIAAFAVGVHKYKSHFLKQYMKKNPLNQDANVINGIDKLLGISIVIIASLLILDTLGFKLGPLVAFGGVGAAALGFAAKDVISNFFGGFMLVVSRPFNLGDSILIPEKKVEAQVIHVGWYMTTLKDKSKRFIYLPNSAFVSAYIINSTRRTHRRIESSLMIKAAEKSKATQALNRIREQLDNYPGLDLNLNPYASLDSCEYGVFKIRISAFTEIKDEREFHEFQEKLLLNLCDIIYASGLQLQESEYILNASI